MDERETSRTKEKSFLDDKTKQFFKYGDNVGKLGKWAVDGSDVVLVLYDWHERQEYDPRVEIRSCLGMIKTCKDLMRIANDIAKRNPDLSELASEVIMGNRKIISDYALRIRRIRSVNKSKIR